LDGYKAGKSIEEVRMKYGLEKVVKLASNENPYGPSPKAIEAFKSFDSLHIYPDPDPLDLREKIGEYAGVEADRITLGAGVDGILENMFKLFVEGGNEVIIPVPSFPYYHILTKLSGGVEVRVSRREDFTVDATEVLNSIGKNTRLIIICSPNNPTGNSENMNELKDIIEDGGVMIFIDEAYAEFSSKNLLDLAQYSNVILARTFSKAFGLANLRIGYAVIPEELRKYFLKVSTPFPLSTPAKQAAIAALDDREYLKMVVDRTVAERETMLRELKKMGVRAFPSESNFIFIETEFDSAYMVEELLKRGIIIRDCSGFTGCNSNHVRVSVGKKEENDMFLEAMGEIY